MGRVRLHARHDLGRRRQWQRELEPLGRGCRGSGCRIQLFGAQIFLALPGDRHSPTAVRAGQGRRWLFIAAGARRLQGYALPHRTRISRQALARSRNRDHPPHHHRSRSEGSRSSETCCHSHRVWSGHDWRQYFYLSRAQPSSPYGSP